MKLNYSTSLFFVFLVFLMSCKKDDAADSTGIVSDNTTWKILGRIENLGQINAGSIYVEHVVPYKGGLNCVIRHHLPIIGIGGGGEIYDY